MLLLSSLLDLGSGSLFSGRQHVINEKDILIWILHTLEALSQHPPILLAQRRSEKSFQAPELFVKSSTYGFL